MKDNIGISIHQKIPQRKWTEVEILEHSVSQIQLLHSKDNLTVYLKNQSSMMLRENLESGGKMKKYYYKSVI